MSAGATIATAAAAVPQLGDEVGQGHDHEREGRVVVVLEGGSINARPWDPLRGEPDGDQHQSEAAPLERLVRHERHGRHPEPPDHEVARVVDRRRRPVAEAALVEPHGFQVEWERPPRR
jgi:hypothetical protein